MKGSPPSDRLRVHSTMPQDLRDATDCGVMPFEEKPNAEHEPRASTRRLHAFVNQFRPSLP
jgi:hypothetical protein